MLEDKITPMNFIVVRDLICELLARERENQIKIARKQGISDEEISQNYDFTIYPKRFRFPDISEMPCVYVYFNELNFPPEVQDVYEYPCDGNLQVEFYAVGENVENLNELVSTADENASDRLEYLTSQLFKILCSEETNVYYTTSKLVGNFTLKRWKRIQTPDETNVARTVLGALLEFNVGFDEPTCFANTTQIKELYTTLKIRDEFISPYIKRILQKEK